MFRTGMALIVEDCGDGLNQILIQEFSGASQLPIYKKLTQFMTIVQKKCNLLFGGSISDQRERTVGTIGWLICPQQDQVRCGRDKGQLQLFYSLCRAHLVAMSN